MRVIDSAQGHRLGYRDTAFRSYNSEVPMKRREHQHSWWRQRLTFLLSAFCLVCWISSPAPAFTQTLAEQQRIVEQSTRTIQRFAADPSMTWFRDKAQYARGIFIVPTVMRGAFFIGATVGNGILLARPDIITPWSQPAFYDIGGASFGFQMGGDASELVLVIMTERGLKSFYSSSFKLGGDASIAAGSDGSGIKGGTSPTLSADIISFGHSQGGYMGISLGGAVVKASHGRNKAYYGIQVEPADILEKGKVRNTASAKLRTAVTEATRLPKSSSPRK